MSLPRFADRSSYNSFLPNGVKWLLIANVSVFILTSLMPESLQGDVSLLALVPRTIVHYFTIWQFVTYMFLHAGIWHLVFNMLTLWMFGTPLEQVWGTRRFLKYYFICGIGAGLCDVILNVALGHNTRTIGASGAIYGLLLAFGVCFPDQTVLMGFLFPIKAKYMVMIFGVIAFISSFQTGSTVSNLAHLGGMIFGFVYIRTQFAARPGKGFRLDLAQRWKEYKMQRARRKFKVYLKKHGSDRDPWVN